MKPDWRTARIAEFQLARRSLAQLQAENDQQLHALHYLVCCWQEVAASLVWVQRSPKKLSSTIMDGFKPDLQKAMRTFARETLRDRSTRKMSDDDVLLCLPAFWQDRRLRGVGPASQRKQDLARINMLLHETMATLIEMMIAMPSPETLGLARGKRHDKEKIMAAAAALNLAKQPAYTGYCARLRAALDCLQP